MDELQLQLDSISNLLAMHIQQNTEKFAEYDKVLSNLKIGDTQMAGAEEIKINNHASDPNAALLAAVAGGNRGYGYGGDGLLGGMGGGGVLGGLLLGGLLRGNNGLLGGGADGGSGVNQITLGQIQSTLGDIKASIPFNEAQVQLALAQQAASITSQLNNIGQNTAALINNSTSNILATGSGIKEAVLTSGNQNILTTLNAQNAVTQAVRDDGDKTRALITSQYEATLNRQLSDANAELVALRNCNVAEEAARQVQVNVTQSVAQDQAQQQQQAQFNNLSSLLLDAVQNIRATNQAINIGAGTQTANPLNTNTNVRT